MASKKKSIAVCLPSELLKKLKAYQQQQKIEASGDAIVAALQAFFEPNAATVQAPLDRLVALEAQVDRLTAEVATLQKFVIPAAVQFDRPPAEAIASVPSDYSYEDFEDEPDEILYDFLDRGNP